LLNRPGLKPGEGLPPSLSAVENSLKENSTTNLVISNNVPESNSPVGELRSTFYRVIKQPGTLNKSMNCKSPNGKKPYFYIYQITHLPTGMMHRGRRKYVGINPD
jgi:hypothetical protein